MRLKASHVLLTISFLFLLILYLNRHCSTIEYLVSLSTSMWIQYTYQYSISDGFINSSFPITFYHEAFVDLRTSPPRLRIYSLNPCIRKSNTLIVDVYFESVWKSKQLVLEGASMEEKCPSMEQYSSPCFYQPHTFSVELPSDRVEKVKIHLGDRQIELSVKPREKLREPGLTVCLQPVYYYSHWQNILLYIEAWRAQGAKRFLVFYHSGTRETRQVLDHYQQLGVIEYRSWPSFGSPSSSKFPTFDDSVFIYSYYLAMNICVLEIRTQLGIIADFDEVMVVKNESIYEYAMREMTGTNIGALRFEASHVAMEPSIYSNDFSGVSRPRFYRRYGAPKHIFNARSIDIAQVHYIRSYLEPKITKPANGVTLHFRYKAEVMFPRMADKPYGFFPNDTDRHVANIKHTAHLIFGKKLPEFPENLSQKHSDCTYAFLNSKTNKYMSCMSKHAACKKTMDGIYDWVYDETNGVFLS